MTQVRRVARRLTAFMPRALCNAVKHVATLHLEAQHRRGYAAYPVGSDEFSDWEAEQVWPE